MQCLRVIATAVLAVSLTAPTAADSPPMAGFSPCYSVASEFKRAKFVVEADAKSEMWTDESGIPHLEYPDGPLVIFDYLGRLNFFENVGVVRSFKGKAPAELRLYKDSDTFRFTRGTRYLLFVTTRDVGSNIGNALIVESCGNSAELRDSGRLISELKRLAA